MTSWCTTQFHARLTAKRNSMSIFLTCGFLRTQRPKAWIGRLQSKAWWKVAIIGTISRIQTCHFLLWILSSFTSIISANLMTVTRCWTGLRPSWVLTPPVTLYSPCMSCLAISWVAKEMWIRSGTASRWSASTISWQSIYLRLYLWRAAIFIVRGLRHRISTRALRCLFLQARLSVR